MVEVTESLKIVDKKKGNTRIELFTDAEGTAVINLYDSEGKVRLTIAVSEDGTPKIYLINSEGKAKTKIG